MTNTNPQDPPIEPTGAEPSVEPATEPTLPEPNAPNEPNEPTEPTEPNGTNGEPTEPIDWKKRSRDWEERSKTNFARAEALEGEKATLQADLEAVRAELAALQASNTREETVRSAAKAANVDEAVLSRMKGDTPEEIAENARILAAATPQPSGYPTVNDGGSGGQTYGMTLEQINAIKDPAARVMARAQYPNAQ